MINIALFGNFRITPSCSGNHHPMAVVGSLGYNNVASVLVSIVTLIVAILVSVIVLVILVSVITLVILVSVIAGIAVIAPVVVILRLFPVLLAIAIESTLWFILNLALWLSFILYFALWLWFNFAWNFWSFYTGLKSWLWNTYRKYWLRDTVNGWNFKYVSWLAFNYLFNFWTATNQFLLTPLIAFLYNWHSRDNFIFTPWFVRVEN